MNDPALAVVRSLLMKELADKKSFKDSRKVEFDIRDLPRGIYYLKVINPRREPEKRVESVRLIFA